MGMNRARRSNRALYLVGTRPRRAPPPHEPAGPSPAVLLQQHLQALQVLTLESPATASAIMRLTARHAQWLARTRAKQG